MSELTVDKIQAYLKEFDGKSTIGDRLMMELSPEHNDVIVHAPVEIYKYLLAQLDTVERETAEKCAEIAEMRQCNCFVQKDLCPKITCPACRSAKNIRDHFKLGEQS